MIITIAITIQQNIEDSNIHSNIILCLLRGRVSYAVRIVLHSGKIYNKLRIVSGHFLTRNTSTL